MGVILGDFLFRWGPGVVADIFIRIHDFTLLLDEEKDCLGGAHLGCSLKIFFQAENFGIVGKLDLQLCLVDFDVYAN